MHSDYQAPVELQLVSIIKIQPNHSTNNLDCQLIQLIAIAVADFSVTFHALSDKRPLTYWQQFAVRRVRYNKAGRLVELVLRDKLKALDRLCKTLGYY